MRVSESDCFQPQEAGGILKDLEEALSEAQKADSKTQSVFNNKKETLKAEQKKEKELHKHRTSVWLQSYKFCGAESWDYINLQMSWVFLFHLKTIPRSKWIVLCLFIWSLDLTMVFKEVIWALCSFIFMLYYKALHFVSFIQPRSPAGWKYSEE